MSITKLAGLWWDRLKALAGKVHRNSVEDVFFGVPTSMWTDISSGCRLRRVLDRDSFRFSALLRYEPGVWWDQFGLLGGKKLSKLGEDESCLLYLLLFCSFCFHYESSVWWDEFR